MKQIMYSKQHGGTILSSTDSGESEKADGDCCFGEFLMQKDQDATAGFEELSNNFQLSSNKKGSNAFR